VKRFKRKYLKVKEFSSNSDEVFFYKMLLKFEKRHPEFNAANMMLKLYPSFDCDHFKPT